MSEENINETPEINPNEDENKEENTQEAQAESNNKRVRVKFAKNVKFGSKRFKKGQTTLVEKEQSEAFKKSGIIE